MLSLFIMGPWGRPISISSLLNTDYLFSVIILHDCSEICSLQTCSRYRKSHTTWCDLSMLKKDSCFCRYFNSVFEICRTATGSNVNSLLNIPISRRHVSQHTGFLDDLSIEFNIAPLNKAGKLSYPRVIRILLETSHSLYEHMENYPKGERNYLAPPIFPYLKSHQLYWIIEVSARVDRNQVCVAQCIPLYRTFHIQSRALDWHPLCMFGRSCLLLVIRWWRDSRDTSFHKTEAELL